MGEEPKTPTRSNQHRSQSRSNHPRHPFDVGLANRVIEDSIKLTASQNYDDDKIHVTRSGAEINIEVKTPDRAVPVFPGATAICTGRKTSPCSVQARG